jgi:hypothetical protein
MARLVGVAGFEPATPASRTQCACSKSLIFLAVTLDSVPFCSRSFHPIRCDIVAAFSWRTELGATIQNTSFLGQGSPETFARIRSARLQGWPYGASCIRLAIPVRSAHPIAAGLLPSSCDPDVVPIVLRPAFAKPWETNPSLRSRPIGCDCELHGRFSAMTSSIATPNSSVPGKARNGCRATGARLHSRAARRRRYVDGVRCELGQARDQNSCALNTGLYDCEFSPGLTTIL